MIVRGATAGDLAAVASCADVAFGVPRSPDNRVELAIQIQQALVQVMCDAARVLGYISFSPNRDHLFVEAIAVLPELHGHGIGSRLSAFAEQVALRLGLRSVRGSQRGHRNLRLVGDPATHRATKSRGANPR